MPKVTEVKKARKDYPNFGIKKGDTYYHWSFKMGPKMMSKTYPKRSQLTRSDFLSQLYDLEDEIGSRFEGIDNPDDISGVLDDLKSDIESLRDSEQDKLDSLPEQFQEAGPGEIINERIEALENWISELEGIDIPSEDDVLEELDESEPKNKDADKKPPEKDEEKKEGESSELTEEQKEHLRVRAEEIIEEILQTSSGL
jgi:hypothetical protein